MLVVVEDILNERHKILEDDEEQVNLCYKNGWTILNINLP